MTAFVPLQVYFSDVFGVEASVLRAYGAFNVSLLRDLPLFIDPFLLFNSRKPEYKALHDEILRYVGFLRDKVVAGAVSKGQLEQWFMFPEVKQTWLGFSRSGNNGSGLGPDFANEFSSRLAATFSSLGRERTTRGSHVEKVGLISEHVGKDNISDFTTNLIKHHLLEFTQVFARQHLAPEHRRLVHVRRAYFDYTTETWAAAHYELPHTPGRRGDFVVLTPLDILTKDENWINKTDLLEDLPEVIRTVSDLQRRTELSGFLEGKLHEIVQRDAEARRKRRRERAAPRGTRSARSAPPPAPPPPNGKQREEAAAATVKTYPVLIDEFIRYKEENGELAEAQANERVRSSEQLYIGHVRDLAQALQTHTDFYKANPNSLDGARRRAEALRQVVERGGAAHAFYANGEPIRLEPDLDVIARLVWLAAPAPTDTAESDESSESRVVESDTVSANASGALAAGVRARFDPDIIRFSLASNNQLGRHLSKRPGLSGPGDAPVLVVLCFSAADRARLTASLREFGLADDPDIFLVLAAGEQPPRSRT